MDNLKLCTRVFVNFAHFSRAYCRSGIRNTLIANKKLALIKHASRCCSRWSRPYAGAPWLVGFALVPAVHGLGFGDRDKEDRKARKPAPDELLLQRADELYARNEIAALYDHLVRHKDTANDEVMWRLCRAACDKAKMSPNKDEKKALMYEAYEYVQRALELNDNNFASHKWYAIMLDYVGEYEGTKQRISNAYKVKEHFMRAIELNPTDATSIHLLGYWCFVFAELPWYQKKVASVIFTTPPSSTYEEALKYFLEAENTSPNFYSRNLLYLGKSYLRLNNRKMALLYLTRARDYPVVTEDDKEAHRESMELLKGLGVKNDAE